MIRISLHTERFSACQGSTEKGSGISVQPPEDIDRIFGDGGEREHGFRDLRTGRAG
jgi:hypothetical protein